MQFKCFIENRNEKTREQLVGTGEKGPLSRDKEKGCRFPIVAALWRL